MQWDDPPVRKRLRLTQFDYADPGYLYFITVRARAGLLFDDTPGLMEIIQEALLWRDKHGVVRLYVYCVMPDHLHLGISPISGGADVPKVLQGLKSHATKAAWKLGATGLIWQRSYYDHIARRAEDCTAIAQ